MPPLVKRLTRSPSKPSRILRIHSLRSSFLQSTSTSTSTSTSRFTSSSRHFEHLQPSFFSHFFSECFPIVISPPYVGLLVDFLLLFHSIRILPYIYNILS